MFNPKNFRECKKCLMSYSLDKFDKKKAVCKSCNSAINKDTYLQKKQLISMDKIKERIPIRNALSLSKISYKVMKSRNLHRDYRFLFKFDILWIKLND